jgi:hypothetical protein
MDLKTILPILCMQGLCELYGHTSTKEKNRGKYTGFPHTAGLKKAAHTLHTNQMSALTCH